MKYYNLNNNCILKRIVAELDTVDPLTQLSRPITHRDVEMQIGLSFPEYNQSLIQNGGIEHGSNFISNFPWDFEHDCDNMEWRLKDSGICSM